MGMVLCKRHGGQTGPLVCEHIGRDAHGIADSAKVPADSSLRLELDLLEDGTELLEHFFCRECVNTHGLSTMKTIPHDLWGSQDKFPFVAPVCGKCFSEWRVRLAGP
jgi:hypothetical protein